MHAGNVGKIRHIESFCDNIFYLVLIYEICGGAVELVVDQSLLSDSPSYRLSKSSICIIISSVLKKNIEPEKFRSTATEKCNTTVSMLFTVKFVKDLGY